MCLRMHSSLIYHDLVHVVHPQDVLDNMSWMYCSYIGAEVWSYLCRLVLYLSIESNPVVLKLLEYVRSFQSIINQNMLK